MKAAFVRFACSKVVMCKKDVWIILHVLLTLTICLWAKSSEDEDFGFTAMSFQKNEWPRRGRAALGAVSCGRCTECQSCAENLSQVLCWEFNRSLKWTAVWGCMGLPRYNSTSQPVMTAKKTLGAIAVVQLSTACFWLFKSFSARSAAGKKASAASLAEPSILGSCSSLVTLSLSWMLKLPALRTYRRYHGYGRCPLCGRQWSGAHKRGEHV